jgi:hypothetical protein
MLIVVRVSSNKEIFESIGLYDVFGTGTEMTETETWEREITEPVRSVPEFRI